MKETFTITTKKIIETDLKKITQEYFDHAKQQFPDENFSSPLDALTRILISPENNAYRSGYIQGVRATLVALL